MNVKKIVEDFEYMRDTSQNDKEWEIMNKIVVKMVDHEVDRR